MSNAHADRVMKNLNSVEEQLDNLSPEGGIVILIGALVFEIAVLNDTISQGLSNLNMRDEDY